MKISIGKRKDVFFLILFSVVLLIVGYIIVNRQNRMVINGYVILSFIINTIIVYFNLIKAVKNHIFSFNMMFWLFSFFFFCLAPLLQYLTGIYSWNLNPTDLEVISTNIFLTIWFVFYILGRTIGKKYILRSRRNKTNVIDDLYKTEYHINHNALNVLLCISIGIVLYYLIRVGFGNLLIRSTNSDVLIDSKAISLITNHGFHNALAFIAAIHIIDAKMHKMKLRTIIAILCFIIGCFPTGIPRNMMASLYVGTVIIFFDSSRNKRWMTWTLIIGLIFVFPMISIFRYQNTIQNESAKHLIMYNIQNTYLTGDYDAHQMFISIQRWVQQDGLSWGHQLAGALLFFVPRSIWPTKAIGTGQSAFIQTNQYWYNNVSAPLPAEGFVNFGIIGMIVFALIVGIFTYKIDKIYWNESCPLSKIRIIYPFLMLMFFFICRGDLQSTGSYFIAQFVVGGMVYHYAIRKKYLYKKH